MSLWKTLTLSATLLAAPAASVAQISTVVVELYTSQGCSSCPPADDFLGELAKTDGVVPLAFHVTYWDRLGWKDTFAHENFTQRQYAYSKTFRNRSVWTPQFIVQGQDYSRNKFSEMVTAFVKEHAKKEASVTLDVSASDGQARIDLDDVNGSVGYANITIAHFHDTAEVAIKRGENAGRTLTYHNIVHEFYRAGTWDGRGGKSIDVTLKAEPPFVVMVQNDDLGPILAAEVIR